MGRAHHDPHVVARARPQGQDLAIPELETEVAAKVSGDIADQRPRRPQETLLATGDDHHFAPPAD